MPAKQKRIRPRPGNVTPKPESPSQKAKHRNAHTLPPAAGAATPTTEEKQPDVAAQMILELAEGGRVTDIIRRSGLSKTTADALLLRLRTRHLPMQMELKRLTTAELIDVIDEKISMALSYMDDVSMQAASASQLAVIFGILSDKRQLLRGEPTQILSVLERSSLDELMPVLLAEAARRGQSVELTQNADGEYVPAGLSPLPYEKDYRTGGFRDKKKLEPER